MIDVLTMLGFVILIVVIDLADRLSRPYTSMSPSKRAYWTQAKKHVASMVATWLESDCMCVGQLPGLRVAASLMVS